MLKINFRIYVHEATGEKGERSEEADTQQNYLKHFSEEWKFFQSFKASFETRWKFSSETA